MAPGPIFLSLLIAAFGLLCRAAGGNDVLTTRIANSAGASTSLDLASYQWPPGGVLLKVSPLLLDYCPLVTLELRPDGGAPDDGVAVTFAGTCVHVLDPSVLGTGSTLVLTLREPDEQLAPGVWLTVSLVAAGAEEPPSHEPSDISREIVTVADGRVTLLLDGAVMIEVAVPLLSAATEIGREVYIISSCEAFLCADAVLQHTGDQPCALGRGQGSLTASLGDTTKARIYVEVVPAMLQPQLCEVTAVPVLRLWPQGREAAEVRATASLQLETEPVWFRFDVDADSSTAFVALLDHPAAAVTLAASPMVGDAPVPLRTPGFMAMNEQHSAFLASRDEVRLLGTDYSALYMWATARASTPLSVVFEAGVTHAELGAAAFAAMRCRTRCQYVLRGASTADIAISRCDGTVSLYLSEHDPTPTPQTAETILNENGSVAVRGALAVTFAGDGVLLVNEHLGRRPALLSPAVEATISQNGTLTALFSPVRCEDCAVRYSLFFVFNSSFAGPLTPCGVAHAGSRASKWAAESDLARDEKGRLTIEVSAQMDNDIPRVTVIASAPPVADATEDDFITHGIVYSLVSSSVVETASSVYLALGIVGGALVVALIAIAVTVSCAFARRRPSREDEPDEDAVDGHEEPGPSLSEDTQKEPHATMLDACADVIVDPLSPLSVLSRQANIDPEALFWYRAVQMVLRGQGCSAKDSDSLETD